MMQTYRTMMKLALAVMMLAALTGAGARAATTEDSFKNLRRVPDAVTAVTSGSGALKLTRGENGQWSGQGVTVKTTVQPEGLAVELAAPGAAVKHLELSWTATLPADWKYLGDAWERSYGDLEWKALDGKRVMPWYFLATDGKLTHGYGVKTGAAALCHWTADAAGIALHCDVRCGGVGVRLGQRRLAVCTVLCRAGREDETPFAAAQAFCRQMCPKPRMPRQPVYGFNDWYCAYGNETAEGFLKNAAYIASLAPKGSNRPFMVMDAGWQVNGDKDSSGTGPWDGNNARFSTTMNMAQFAQRIRELDARPGIWVRPLLTIKGQPRAWQLSRDRTYLDPSVPEVRAYVKETIARLHTWGFELIKHDFTTWDIMGKWGFEMGDKMTPDGWSFADPTLTTAEVFLNLYRDIREAAGEDTLVLGCNTVGHLTAGLFEMQRIGDDTSGKEWARTRKMGVNTLAFRAPQHGTFFAVDGDCAGQVNAGSVPWEKNRQWLDLLGRSGTPLFVSFPRSSVSPEQEQGLRAALAAAARPLPVAEPQDWLKGRTPSQWRLEGGNVSYQW